MSSTSAEQLQQQSCNKLDAKSSNSDVDGNVSAEDACVVCFKNVDIYSIGECDHPVCYECSTRMRVLCQQNECPICRHVLAKVIFTTKKLPYRELEANNRSEYYSRRYKIGFSSNEIQQAFFELLDHPCPKCDVPPYRSFQGLRNHVRKEHDLIYCDLCVENLKIFTFERRCYTHAELRVHLTKGDADNKSHRGHPLCEYCNKRYLDRDELFRHLRREHYFCHFCDADGCNEFYRDYDALAAHFRQDHYLCEEGRCATEQFVGAFRSEIDYKAHVSNVHGKSLNKQQAKQTRILQLEITLGRRGRNGQTEEGIASMRTSRNGEHTSPDRAEDVDFVPNHATAIDASNEQDFPSLAGINATTNLSLARPPPPALRHRNTMSGLARTRENFPALGNNNGSAAAAAQQQQTTTHMSRVVRPSSDAATGMLVHVSNRPTKSIQQPTVAKKAAATKLNEFPSLAASTNSKHAAAQQQQATTSMGKVVRPSSNAATGVISRNAQNATTITNAATAHATMMMHVSNRPKKSTQQPAVNEFPSLTASANGKHKSKQTISSLDDEDDVFPVIASTMPSLNVAAKHRALVDDYVSIANPSNFHKIQLVQKQEEAEQARKAKEKLLVPKLTSQDFPSLSGGSTECSKYGGTTMHTWVKPNAAAVERKQRELENRKAKVAPAPLLQRSKTDATVKVKNEKRNQVNKEQNNNEKNLHKKNYNNNEELSSVTLNSVAKLPNNLTFTSSSGAKFDIAPTTHSYVAPTDAANRNQQLMTQFRECLKTKAALEEFRQISQLFREGKMPALAYYEHCQSALEQQFDNVFPELIALLPDISKQQALYLVHSQRLNAMSKANKTAITAKLQVCSKCKQVLKATDMADHDTQHDLRANFPTLNSISARKNSK